MQVTDITFETTDDILEAVLTFSTPADEVDKYIKDYFKDMAQKGKFDGFRKGKAPRHVIEAYAGGKENAMAAVAETIINGGGFAAIDEADVFFLGQPEFNVDVMPEDGKPFTFTCSGHVAPQIELSDYGPVAIEMPPDQATESEIELQLEGLRSCYYENEPVDDPAYEAAMGDIVTCVLTVTREDGRIVAKLDDATRMITLGAGIMPESFDEKLVGAKVGEQHEFDFEAKGEKAKPEFGDGNLHASVLVEKISKRILPDLDDAFAQKIGVNTVAELRQQMELSINNSKNKELPKLMEDRVIFELTKRIQGEVPEYFVDYHRELVGGELLRGLQDQGVNLQEWLIQNQMNGDEVKEEVTAEAIRRANNEAAIDAVFRAQGWTLTEEDIRNELKGEEDAEEVLQAWADAHKLAELRRMVRQNKTVRWLLDTADVTVVEE